MKVIEDSAKYYFNLGLNVTCIGDTINEHNYYCKNILKSPNHIWKHLFAAKQRETEFKSYDWENATGVGSVTGYNDLRVIDIDGCSDYKLLHEILKILNLPTNYEWVTISGSNNGFHIYINCRKFSYLGDNQVVTTFPPKPEFDKQFDKIEILWNTHIVLPPSLHKTGNKYRFLNCDKPLSLPRSVKHRYVSTLINNYLQAEKKVIGMGYGEELVEFIPPITLTEILKKLIDEHGSEILKQQQRIKAILSDLLPNEKRTQYLLELSLRAEIPQKLMSVFDNERSVWDAQLNSIKQYFKNDFFLEDKAVKSVFDCWEEVLSTKDINTNIVTDIDGNVYKTVQIGTQIWMAENLRVSRYRNGDLISNVENHEERRSIIATGACCNYNYNPDYDFEYGKLYNWYAVVDKRGLAPKGWHVPSAEEWLILIDFLGGKYIAGGKLKEAGKQHWEMPNKGATNESGFTALPAGNSTGSGYFGSLGSIGEWWGTTIWNGGGNRLSLSTIRTDLDLEGCSPSWSLSVRCLKDY
jgi:uncharacterized protein (TIGR02145 family)